MELHLAGVCIRVLARIIKSHSWDESFKNALAYFHYNSLLELYYQSRERETRFELFTIKDLAPPPRHLLSHNAKKNVAREGRSDFSFWRSMRRSTKLLGPAIGIVPFRMKQEARIRGTGARGRREENENEKKERNTERNY